MTILLDIDGVLETTLAWRRVEVLADGFMKLNENFVENLQILYERTNASIVLTSTHRVNFDEAKWKEIFRTRGLYFETILKLNDKMEISQMLNRITEIKEWVEKTGENLNYVILTTII